MYVEFVQPWQDGFAKYQVGQVCDVKDEYARQYIELGKAKETTVDRAYKADVVKKKRARVPGPGRYPTNYFSTSPGPELKEGLVSGRD